MPNRKHQPITAKQVLAATIEVRRLGVERSLAKLETEQPDLAEYVMEALSQAHASLLKLGAPARPTQRVFLEFQSIVLVCAAALRPGAKPRRPPDAGHDLI